jgi:hypothetical protein
VGGKGFSVGIRLNGHGFDGPYARASDLEDRSGVYAILTLNGDKYRVLDIGESATVKSRVETHPRGACWRQHAISGVYCAVLYTEGLQSSGRVKIEQALRAFYKPPCGDR